MCYWINPEAKNQLEKRFPAFMEKYMGKDYEGIWISFRSFTHAPEGYLF